MYLPFVYKTIILGHTKIVALNFTMYILTILTCSLKVNVFGKIFFKTQTSLNPITMNIFLRRKMTVFLYNYKKHATRDTKDLNKIL